VDGHVERLAVEVQVGGGGEDLGEQGAGLVLGAGVVGADPSGQG
jgi:hypothetical protein